MGGTAHGASSNARHSRPFWCSDPSQMCLLCSRSCEWMHCARTIYGFCIFTWTLWSKLLTIRMTRPALGFNTFGAVDVISASSTDVAFRTFALLPQPWLPGDAYHMPVEKELLSIVPLELAIACLPCPRLLLDNRTQIDAMTYRSFSRSSLAKHRPQWQKKNNRKSIYCSVHDWARLIGSERISDCRQFAVSRPTYLE